MTRINIAIPEEIHKELKIKAATESTTLKDLIVKKIEEKLEKLEKKGR